MRKTLKVGLWKGAAAAAVIAAMSAGCAQAAGAPVTTADGFVQVPAFDLPPSDFMSKEAVALLKRNATRKVSATPPSATIAQSRADLETMLAPSVQATQARYPVDIVQRSFAGVPARVITPKGGKVDPKRVLINLHGGGFSMCAVACALLESVPIASVGGFKVISVDYRQGPEHKFPAANEDVAAVYRELLKSYRPKQIGIFGCSAGGALSAQTAAWLPAHGLPQAGAIGVFGAGGARFGAGDSAYVSGYLGGTFPPPPPARPGAPPSRGMPLAYFDGVDMADPMVSPAGHPDVLAKFPPTLIITGSRAMDMSPAIYTHSQLVKAGVPGNLIVGEGLGHCYIYYSELPEAQDGYKAIVEFFRKNLG